MGYMAHHALIITIPDFYLEGDFKSTVTYANIEKFRESLPEEWRRLLIGPIKGIVNSDSTIVFLPDGSKEGWGTSDAGDRYRAELAALFNDSYADVVQVRFGGDDWDIVEAHDPRGESKKARERREG